VEIKSISQVKDIICMCRNYYYCKKETTTYNKQIYRIVVVEEKTVENGRFGLSTTDPEVPLCRRREHKMISG